MEGAPPFSHPHYTIAWRRKKQRMGAAIDIATHSSHAHVWSRIHSLQYLRNLPPNGLLPLNLGELSRYIVSEVNLQL